MDPHLAREWQNYSEVAKRSVLTLAETHSLDGRFFWQGSC